MINYKGEVTVDLLVEKVNEYREFGFTLTEIQKYTGVNRKTFYRILSRYNKGEKFGLQDDTRIKVMNGFNKLDKELAKKLRKYGLR